MRETPSTLRRPRRGRCAGTKLPSSCWPDSNSIVHRTGFELPAPGRADVRMEGHLAAADDGYRRQRMAPFVLQRHEQFCCRRCIDVESHGSQQGAPRFVGSVMVPAVDVGVEIAQAAVPGQRAQGVDGCGAGHRFGSCRNQADVHGESVRTNLPSGTGSNPGVAKTQAPRGRVAPGAGAGERLASSVQRLPSPSVQATERAPRAPNRDA